MLPVLMLTCQDPAGPKAPELLHQLQHLGWVDHTALAVLLVFFVLGLFKGLIWQVSRIGILVVAYVAAGRFGGTVGEWFARTPAVGGTAQQAPADAPETTLYLAYVLIFLVVLVALSLLAMLIHRLAQKAGLGFFDRLGGGLLGIATGACVVLFGLFVVNMFFSGSQLASAAETSHALRISQRAIDLLGEGVPDELRTVIALAPLHTPVAPKPSPTPGGAPAGGPATEALPPGPDAAPPAAAPTPGSGSSAGTEVRRVPPPVEPQQPPR